MSRPAMPLRQFVLKVHGRCDLACDHCYVYQGPDQSWRNRPMAMSDETIAWTAQRIAEHAKTHQLRRVHVVLHGGEPLLAGPLRLKLIAETLRVALNGVCDLDLRIHTNGVLLDERFCELFAACDIKVGISIDGYRAANDRHRRYADGRSSYDQVLRAIGLLRSGRYRELYAGLLCTIDVANDPVAVYESLLELDPPRIDFLLPHATWDAPPARPAGSQTPYADWMIAIFDRWLAGGKPVGVRTFDSLIRTSNGGDSLTESFGLGPADLVVIETDGSYEQADSLKAAFEGAPATGLTVFADSLDAVSEHPGIVARQGGVSSLCDTCRCCPVVTSCGGGLYAHRYRSGSGFANPSVYCSDLMKLIWHVRGRTRHGAMRSLSGLPAHAIPAAEFRELACGYGGADALGRLADAQRSLGRALLTAVHQKVMLQPAAAVADTPKAWELLVRIDRDHPHVIGHVLSHPYLRVWAAHCLERLREASGAGTRSAVPLATDLGYLAAVAAAAAIRSGVGAKIRVPVRDGVVYLPTLGRLDVGGTGSERPGPPADRPPELALVTVEDSRDAVTIQTPASRCRLARADLLTDAGDSRPAPAGSWQPTRQLTAPGISVTLEDADPYRDCYGWSASARLSDAEFGAWQRRFRQAWAEIRQVHPDYAPGIGAGLGTIVPLSPTSADREVSATARHAFGAIAAALPADPSTLALLMMHEFQHVKLGGLLDLYELYDTADARLFPAPWRDDLRPLEGLLQGTYAHIAVTDYWRSHHRTADPADSSAETARERFVHWRTHTAAAVETLARSGSLTSLGEQVINGMRDSVTPWLAEPAAALSPVDRDD